MTLLALGFGLLASSVSAADQLELLSLEDELLPEPRVTAEAVFVGLVWPRRSETDASAGSILAAIPPELRTDDVCVQVTTEDGRYTGNARYRDTGIVTSAMTLLPYTSPKPGLNSYVDEHVAVLAYPCGTDAGLTRVAVSSWRSNAIGGLGEQAHLLVNSFRADEAFLLVDGAKEIECISMGTGERAAYDFTCPLNITDIRNGAQVSLFRVRGASIDPEVATEIVGWE